LVPELHRLDGGLAPNRPEPDRARAEACLLQAIDIARSLEARLLELSDRPRPSLRYYLQSDFSIALIVGYGLRPSRQRPRHD
jgi:hypothetical protein